MEQQQQGYIDKKDYLLEILDKNKLDFNIQEEIARSKLMALPAKRETKNTSHELEIASKEETNIDKGRRQLKNQRNMEHHFEFKMGVFRLQSMLGDFFNSNLGA